ncbi:hypothetical protein [Pleomorphovibrio marinus]|uniref:hypothetical protein n=1 Tax=Pleomorphovibrio marinus TaxID=2164132 RepID=UPI000E0AF6C9|nr:hypothetical protein [Pleomorphovibrio marinus]
MKYTLLIFLILTNVKCFGQGSDSKDYSDSERKKIQIAENFLIETFSETFLNDTLEFKGLYKSVLDMVAFEIKNDLSTDTSRNMILVFLNGENVETEYNTKITRQNVYNYFKGVSNENIYLNHDYALSLAKRANFEKGIKGWIISISGVADSVWWTVKSYQKVDYDPVYSANGKDFKVNIRDGKIKISEWVEIE